MTRKLQVQADVGLVMLAAFAAVGVLIYELLNGETAGARIAVLVSTVLTLILSLRLVSRRTTLQSQLVVGGLPFAGKTVFANVLYRYFHKYESAILQLEPRAATAEAVLEAVNHIEDGQWPAETDPDEVRDFRGVLEFQRERRLFGRLITGQARFPFVLRDAAGNHWLESPKGSNIEMSKHMVRLTSKAHGILYVFDLAACESHVDVTEAARHLLASLSRIREAMDLAPREKLPQPVAIVVSKIDRLSADSIEQLRELAPIPPSSQPVADLVELDDSVVKRFTAVVQEVQGMCTDARVFAVSSIGFNFWDTSEVEPFGVEEPFAWCLRRIFANRRRLAVLDEIFPPDDV